MDDDQAAGIGRKLGQGVFDRLDRALHVALDNDLELLDVSFLQAGIELVEGDLAGAGQFRFAQFTLAMAGHVLGRFFVFYRMEGIPCVGSS